MHERLPTPVNARSGLGTGGTCLARMDLELATEHYRGRNLAEKVRAGFSIYAHAQDAPGLRRVLDQHELTAEILSL